MLDRRTCFLAACVAAASAAHAQVTPLATARRFEAMGSMVPRGADVTAGASVSAPNAAVRFTNVVGAGEIRSTLVASTTWFNSRGGRPALTAFGEVDLALRSAVPIPVVITVSVGVAGFAGGTGVVDVGGLGTVDIASRTGSFEATVDAQGLVIDIDILSYAPPVPTNGLSAWGQTVTAEVVVAPRLYATPYGDPCGATLEATADLLSPEHTITASDPTGATFGVLWVGTERIYVPFRVLLPVTWSCALRTDIVFAVPLRLDPRGTARLALRVPPGTYTMQVATDAGTTVHASNGLEFDR